MGFYNIAPIGEQRRDVFYIQGLTDLAKQQDDAYRRSVDYLGNPVLVVIHHHQHGVSCGNYKHEAYKNREQVPFNG